MSRTDKDQPLWVRAEWFEPRHRCGWHLRYQLDRETGEFSRQGWEFDECDLLGGPVREVNHTTWWRDKPMRCRWMPVWDRRRPGRGAPRWFVRLQFTGPGRAHVRADCRRATAEHRGCGEVEVIPPTTQHRHSARWDWD